MAKRLQYSRIQLVPKNGALMLVSLLDDEGNAYTWAPKWSEVRETFMKQVNVERHNKPDSQFLNQFARTVQDVVEGAQRITSAYKVQGYFIKYEDGKLVIENPIEERYELMPAFDVSVSFLDTWLRRNVEALVVNNMVIRLSYLITTDNIKEGIIEEYPPPEEPEDLPVEPEDLPFE